MSKKVIFEQKLFWPPRYDEDGVMIMPPQYRGLRTFDDGSIEEFVEKHDVMVSERGFYNKDKFEGLAKPPGGNSYSCSVG